MRNSKAQSFSYYFSFFTFGLIVSSLGPSIPQLVLITKTSIGTISFLFTSYNLGILLGSLIGGFLFDKIKSHPVMFFSLILIASLFWLIPHTSNFIIIIVQTFIIGISLGIILVGGNTLIVWVNSTNLGLWMNGLHMFSGIGAFLSPLIISFLLKKFHNLIFSYIIISSIALLSAIPFLIVSSPKIKRIKASEKIIKKTQLFLIILISIMFLVYVGVESGFGGFIYLFTIKKFNNSPEKAGIITSVFWLSLIIGRFLNMLFHFRYKAKVEKQLFISFISGILFLFLINYFSININILLILTLCAGLSMSIIFPSIMTYSDSQLHLTGKITSIFFVSTSIGAIFIPTIIGNLVELKGYKVIPFILNLTLFIAFILFLITEMYRRKKLD